MGLFSGYSVAMVVSLIRAIIPAANVIVHNLTLHLMKKTPYYLVLIWITLVVGCTPQGKQVKEEVAVTFPERGKAMNIYEVNVRQYTPEGTFNAFAEHLPRLKDMGVDILWLMPIQPIGVEKRKGGLGSYYSIQDYSGINAEYGTSEDFKSLVSKVHELDMLLIIDWVPNHTAWDHEWILANTAYYERDEKGEIVTPFDWTDVAQLNYDNYEMRQQMIQEMRYWVETFDIDGFRQDNAGRKIPIDFWQTATEELNQIKDLFWLAEWNTPQMHFAFDATYAWAFHHLSGEVVRGEKSANEIEELLKKDRHEYGKHAYRMTFTSNHDENSWQGTVFERYGEGYQTMAVLMATIEGIPLVYSGQEAQLDKRLRFFEKDTIAWDEVPLHDFYKTLLNLRKDNKALWSGDFGGRSVRVNVDNKDNVYAFQRVKDENSVLVLLNLTGEPQSFSLGESWRSGTYQEVFTQQDKNLNPEQPVELAPWEYQVFTFNSTGS